MFGLYLFDATSRVGVRHPRNVIVGCLDRGTDDDVLDVVSKAHGFQANVTSYAIFKGAPPGSGKFVTITSRTASNVTCTASKGRGKKAGTVVVSVDYNIEFDGVQMDPNLVSGVMWVERHLVVDDVRGRRNAGTVSSGDVSGSLSMEAAGAISVDGEVVVDVEVVVDYVFPIGFLDDHVYDPGKNDAPTTAGFGGDPLMNPWKEVTKVNMKDFPVVTSETSTVTCS